LRLLGLSARFLRALSLLSCLLLPCCCRLGLGFGLAMDLLRCRTLPRLALRTSLPLCCPTLRFGASSLFSPAT
jgi:hypothetical protein